jgi:hypothetical protein
VTPSATIRPKLIELGSDDAWHVRASRLFVMALCIGYGIAGIIWSTTAWEIPDIGAYWNAAMRLQAGEELYPAVTDVNASDVYRYAPWFAFLWIPLTHFPRALVDGLWSVVLVGSIAATVVPALRLRDPAVVAFTFLAGSFLVLIAARGNVQPLMVAALVYGVERRSGPLWIAAAASLKATPILFVLVYVARGEWKRAAITIGVTAALVLPMLAFGIEGYTTNPGPSTSLYTISPAAFAGVGVTSIVAALYVARRYPVFGWLAAALAVILCLPRMFPYEYTFLFVGLVPLVAEWRRREDASTTNPPVAPATS